MHHVRRKEVMKNTLEINCFVSQLLEPKLYRIIYH